MALDSFECTSHPKWAYFVSELEDTINAFEAVAQTKEWQDLIGCLAALTRVFTRHSFNAVPVTVRATLFKRLAQCMHRQLPAGVHIKALETYDVILQRVGPRGLARDLSLFSLGLFPLLAYSSTRVRPALLDLFERHYVPLGPLLIPALSGLITALLPGLEETSSEHYPRVVCLLDAIRVHVSSATFMRALWKVVSSNPTQRLSALQYASMVGGRARRGGGDVATSITQIVSEVSSQEEDDVVVLSSSALEEKESKLHESIDDPLPPVSETWVSESLIVHPLHVCADAIVRCLTDLQNIYVQRAVLEFLSTFVPLGHPAFLSAHWVQITASTLSICLQDDVSLKRRLHTFLSRPHIPSEQVENASKFQIPNMADSVVGIILSAVYRSSAQSLTHWAASEVETTSHSESIQMATIVRNIVSTFADRIGVEEFASCVPSTILQRASAVYTGARPFETCNQLSTLSIPVMTSEEIKDTLRLMHILRFMLDFEPFKSSGPVDSFKAHLSPLILTLSYLFRKQPEVRVHLADFLKSSVIFHHFQLLFESFSSVEMISEALSNAAMLHITNCVLSEFALDSIAMHPTQLTTLVAESLPTLISRASILSSADSATLALFCLIRSSADFVRCRISNRQLISDLNPIVNSAIQIFSSFNHDNQLSVMTLLQNPGQHVTSKSYAMLSVFELALALCSTATLELHQQSLILSRSRMLAVFWACVADPRNALASISLWSRFVDLNPSANYPECQIVMSILWNLLNSDSHAKNSVFQHAAQLLQIISLQHPILAHSFWRFAISSQLDSHFQSTFPMHSTSELTLSHYFSISDVSSHEIPHDWWSLMAAKCSFSSDRNQPNHVAFNKFAVFWRVSQVHHFITSQVPTPATHMCSVCVNDAQHLCRVNMSLGQSSSWPWFSAVLFVLQHVGSDDAGIRSLCRAWVVEFIESDPEMTLLLLLPAVVHLSHPDATGNSELDSASSLLGAARFSIALLEKIIQVDPVLFVSSLHLRATQHPMLKRALAVLLGLPQNELYASIVVSHTARQHEPERDASLLSPSVDEFRTSIQNSDGVDLLSLLLMTLWSAVDLVSSPVNMHADRCQYAIQALKILQTLSPVMTSFATSAFSSHTDHVFKRKSVSKLQIMSSSLLAVAVGFERSIVTVSQLHSTLSVSNSDQPPFDSDAVKLISELQSQLLESALLSIISLHAILPLHDSEHSDRRAGVRQRMILTRIDALFHSELLHSMIASGIRGDTRLAGLPLDRWCLFAVELLPFLRGALSKTCYFLIGELCHLLTRSLPSVRSAQGQVHPIIERRFSPEQTRSLLWTLCHVVQTAMFALPQAERATARSQRKLVENSNPAHHQPRHLASDSTDPLVGALSSSEQSDFDAIDMTFGQFPPPAPETSSASKSSRQTTDTPSKSDDSSGFLSSIFSIFSKSSTPVKLPTQTMVSPVVKPVSTFSLMTTLRQVHAVAWRLLPRVIDACARLWISISDDVRLSISIGSILRPLLRADPHRFVPCLLQLWQDALLSASDSAHSLHRSSCALTSPTHAKKASRLQSPRGRSTSLQLNTAAPPSVPSGEASSSPLVANLQVLPIDIHVRLLELLASLHGSAVTPDIIIRPMLQILKSKQPIQILDNTVLHFIDAYARSLDAHYSVFLLDTVSDFSAYLDRLSTSSAHPAQVAWTLSVLHTILERTATASSYHPPLQRIAKPDDEHMSARFLLPLDMISAQYRGGDMVRALLSRAFPTGPLHDTVPDVFLPDALQPDHQSKARTIHVSDAVARELRHRAQTLIARAMVLIDTPSASGDVDSRSGAGAVLSNFLSPLAVLPTDASAATLESTTRGILPPFFLLMPVSAFVATSALSQSHLQKPSALIVDEPDYVENFTQSRLQISSVREEADEDQLHPTGNLMVELDGAAETSPDVDEDDEEPVPEWLSLDSQSGVQSFILELQFTASHEPTSQSDAPVSNSQQFALPTATSAQSLASFAWRVKQLLSLYVTRSLTNIIPALLPRLHAGIFALGVSAYHPEIKLSVSVVLHPPVHEHSSSHSLQPHSKHDAAPVEVTAAPKQVTRNPDIARAKLHDALKSIMISVWTAIDAVAPGSSVAHTHLTEPFCDSYPSDRTIISLQRESDVLICDRTSAIAEFARCAVWMLAQLSAAKHIGTLVVWRGDAWSRICSPDFFRRVSLPSLTAWRLICSRLLLEEQSYVRHLLQPLASASSSASVLSFFQSHATEVHLRAVHLRRLSFAIFSSSFDAFSRFMPTIAEILVDALKVQRASELHIEAFHCLRVLCTRVGGDLLISVWSIALTEAVRALESADPDPPLIAAVCGFLDAASLLLPEQYGAVEWMFVRDAWVIPTEEQTVDGGMFDFLPHVEAAAAASALPPMTATNLQEKATIGVAAGTRAVIGATSRQSAAAFLLRIKQGCQVNEWHAPADEFDELMLSLTNSTNAEHADDASLFAPHLQSILSHAPVCPLIARNLGPSAFATAASRRRWIQSWPNSFVDSDSLETAVFSDFLDLSM